MWGPMYYAYTLLEVFYIFYLKFSFNRCTVLMFQYTLK